MATASIKPSAYKRQETTDCAISTEILEEFKKLSTQRQLDILKESAINAKSFMEKVSYEKEAISSDLKQFVKNFIKTKEQKVSNAKQIERAYGDVIKENYEDGCSIKIIAEGLIEYEKNNPAEAKHTITASILRAVISNMKIQRADDLKKGRRKSKKRKAAQAKRVKADAQLTTESMTDMETADGEQLEEQIVPEIESRDVEQIEKQIVPGIENSAAGQLVDQMTDAELVDGEQFEKQIDPEIESATVELTERQVDSEIENVQLENLGNDTDSCGQSVCR